MKALGAFGTILLLFLAGCGEPPVGTVRGKVTHKGKPVILGGVSFISDGSLPKYAVIQKDGSYEAVGVRAGGTTVNDLLGALNRLSVPVEDRVAILTEIHRLGKLHAKLLFEE